MLLLARACILREPAAVRGCAGSAIGPSHTVRALLGGPRLASATDVLDLRAPQVYFRQVFSGFGDVRPVGRPGAPAVDTASYAVVKFGQHGEGSGRQARHAAAFPGSRLLDSSLTLAYSHVEQKARDRWLAEGLLHSGRHEAKAARDTELLLFRSQADYERAVQTVAGLIRGLARSEQLDVEQERTRQAQLAVRLRELDVELEMVRRGTVH